MSVIIRKFTCDTLYSIMNFNNAFEVHCLLLLYIHLIHLRMYVCIFDELLIYKLNYGTVPIVVSAYT